MHLKAHGLRALAKDRVQAGLRMDVLFTSKVYYVLCKRNLTLAEGENSCSQAKDKSKSSKVHG